MIHARMDITQAPDCKLNTSKVATIFDLLYDLNFVRNHEKSV